MRSELKDAKSPPRKVELGSPRDSSTYFFALGLGEFFCFVALVAQNKGEITIRKTKKNMCYLLGN